MNRKTMVMLCMGYMLLTSNLIFAKEFLNILVWDASYLPEKSRHDFERQIKDKYDVDLEIIVKIIKSPEHIYDELRSGGSHLASPTHNIINDERFNYINKNLILPIDVAKIENFKYVNASLTEISSIYKDGKYYGVPFVFGPYGLIYNKTKIPDPKTINSIWDDKFKGKYAISGNHYEANVYLAATSLGYEAHEISKYNILTSDQRFNERFKSLAVNTGTFWIADNPDAMKDYSISMSWGFALAGLNKNEHNWYYAQVKEKITAWMDPYVIGHALRDKPMLRKIAEEWVNYSLSKEYQVNAVVRSLGSFPTTTNLLDDLTPEEIEKFHVDDLNYVTEKLILWPEMSMRERNGFKNLWEKHLNNLDHIPRM